MSIVDPNLISFVRDAVYAGVIGGAAYDGLKKIFSPIFGGMWDKWHDKKIPKDKLEKEIEEVLKDENVRKKVEQLQIYKFYQIHSGSGDNIAIIINYMNPGHNYLFTFS